MNEELSAAVVRQVEVLRVAPGEVLIVRLPSIIDQAFANQLHADLESIGLAGRVDVIRVDDAEFVVVEPAAATVALVDEPELALPPASSEGGRSPSQ